MSTASFDVDPDAAAEAKRTGNYPVDEGAPKADDKPADDKPLISDEDPGAKPAADAKPADDKKADDKPADDKPADDQKAAPPIKEAMEGWTKEFVEKGELSAESRAAVKARLFHPDVEQEVVDGYIDDYIAGMTHSGDAYVTEAHNLAGGAEGYKAMVEWASQNVPVAELQAFNDAVLSDDTAKRDSAIQGLHARYLQSSGREPNHEVSLAHRGVGGRAPGDPIIGSRSELVRIMQSPEYEKDPAVRDRVQRQLKQSMDTGKYIND